MADPDRTDQVPPAPTEIFTYTIFFVFLLSVQITVASHIKTHVTTCPVTKGVVYFRIHIEEMITTPDLLLFPAVESFQQRPGNQLHPGTPDRHIERGFSFYDRPLQVAPQSQQTNRKITMIFIPVAIIGPYVYYGRKPSSVFGRKASFIKCCIFDGIRVKGGKETEQMVGVINRIAIQQKEVPIRITSPDMKSGHPFGPHCNTGQSLQGFHHIRLPQQGRHRLDTLGRHLHNPGSRA